MPAFVVERIADALNDRRKAVRGSKILLSGMTYKRDIDDVRESPAFDVLELLERRAAEVSYYDPYVPSVQVGERRLQSVNLESVGSFDAVVIITDHTNVDYGVLVERAQLVIDCRNATRKFRGQHAAKIVTL
jgi:UDP-N-acetyl-D-glucosamine dehydrogenase